MGAVILAEGQKERQEYRFCADLCYINTVSTQHVYPLPSIPEIVDEQTGHDLWCLQDMNSGFYNVLVAEHAC